MVVSDEIYRHLKGKDHEQKGIDLQIGEIPHTKRPELLTLAQNIITAQNKEIDEMMTSHHQEAVNMANLLPTKT